MERSFLNELRIFERPQEFLNDSRMSRVYHTACEFEIKKFSDLEQWNGYREKLRERILISSGLWPLPEKCKLNAKIFYKREFDGFTIEKVSFESQCGFFVTGNLYRPSAGKGPFPVIINPHGHWDDGRLEASETTNIPLRCANFAKLGFIAFSYDMVGYCDSMQVEHSYVGYDKELWAANLLGLQLWNSMRVLDFIETLPDADIGKIGCTGASGGGSQTIMLSAVDERVSTAMSVNIVSNNFQGGCYCENAANLRIGATNVEFASMMAPRPMLLVGCTADWTINLPDEIYPAIREIYRLYNKEENVDYYFEDAEHNYNKNAREQAYKWFSKQLAGKELTWKEQEIDLGNIKDLRIFPENGYPRDLLGESALFENQKKNRIKQLKQLWMNREEAVKVLGASMECITGVSAGKLAVENEKTVSSEGLIIKKLVISNDANGSNIPTVIIKRHAADYSKKAVLAIHPKGKAGLFSGIKHRKLVEMFLGTGGVIAAPDVFLTGEFNLPFGNSGRDFTRVQVKSKFFWRSFFTTYNFTDDAYRVQDIVTAYSFLKKSGYREIELIGFEAAGPWVVAALPFMPGVKLLAADIEGFDMQDDWQDDWEYVERFYIPGFLASGGFKSCLRLGNIDKIVTTKEFEEEFCI